MQRGMPLGPFCSDVTFVFRLRLWCAAQSMRGCQHGRFPIGIATRHGSPQRNRLNLASKIGEIFEILDRKWRDDKTLLIARYHKLLRHKA
jgi:hypothetical protein